MKRHSHFLLTGVLLAASSLTLPAFAQVGPQDHHDQDHNGYNDRGDHGGGDHGDHGGDHGGGYHDDRGNYRDDYRGGPGHGPPPPRRWSRGDRINDNYHGRVVVVNDYRNRHLRRPPHGYHWVRDDNDNLLMVAVATGVITDIVLNSH